MDKPNRSTEQTATEYWVFSCHQASQSAGSAAVPEAGANGASLAEQRSGDLFTLIVSRMASYGLEVDPLLQRLQRLAAEFGKFGLQYIPGKYMDAYTQSSSELSRYAKLLADCPENEYEALSELAGRVFTNIRRCLELVRQSGLNPSPLDTALAYVRQSLRELSGVFRKQILQRHPLYFDIGLKVRGGGVPVQLMPQHAGYMVYCLRILEHIAGSCGAEPDEPLLRIRPAHYGKLLDWEADYGLHLDSYMDHTIPVASGGWNDSGTDEYPF